MDNEIKAVYLADVLPAPPYWIDRQKIRGIRHYIAHWEDESVEAYVSNTTFLQKYKETPKSLVDWQLNNHGNADHYRHHLNELADNGSIIHALIAQLKLFEIPLDDDEGFLDLACDLAKSYKRSREWVEDRLYKMSKAIASFLAWCRDYQVEILAVEVPLVSRYYQVGAQLDFVVMMNDKKYNLDVEDEKELKRRKKARVRAIVDFKSGTIQSDHGDQLMVCKLIFEDNYPDFKIDRLYNLAPTDYRGTEAKYTLKNQEKNACKTRVLLKLTLWKLEHETNQAKKDFMLAEEEGKHERLRVVEKTNGWQQTHLPRRIRFTKALGLGDNPDEHTEMVSGLDHYLSKRPKDGRSPSEATKTPSEGDTVEEELSNDRLVTWTLMSEQWCFKNSHGHMEPGMKKDQLRLNALYASNGQSK